MSFVFILRAWKTILYMGQKYKKNACYPNWQTQNHDKHFHKNGKELLCEISINIHENHEYTVRQIQGATVFMETGAFQESGSLYMVIL